MKKNCFKLLAFAIALSIVSVSCSKDDGTVSVTGVEMNRPAIELAVGGTATLTATVAPQGATNKNVTWKSVPESVATVADGVVTAVAKGTATITVTTEDGGITADCTVTVLPQPTVYIAGLSNGNAVLWTDGEEQILATGGAQTTSMAVSDGDVYVVGMAWDNAAIANVAMLWKNGEPQTLTAGNSQAKAVTVSEGDVYVVGQQYNTSNWTNNATLWKNGAAQSVSTENSQAWGVSVSGGDVYVAGNITDASYKNSAVLWKNGVAQNLDNGEYAYNCYVSGGDVYVAGVGFYSGGQYDGDSRAALWKNGTIQSLEQTIEEDDWVESGQGKSIVVADGNVYVAGRQMFYNTLFKKATLWTNGEAEILNRSGNSDAYAVSVYGGNVYVVGEVQGTDNVTKATLWKNGEIVWQSAGPGSATCIVVTE